MKMHETGLILKWQRKWLRSSKDCTDSKVSNTKLDLSHFVGLFIIYGVYIVASFLLFIVEIIHGKLKTREDEHVRNDNIGQDNNNIVDEITAF